MNDTTTATFECACGKTVPKRQAVNHERSGAHQEWIRTRPVDGNLEATLTAGHGKLQGDVAPPEEYDAAAAAARSAPPEDIDATELTPAQAAARANARANGEPLPSVASALEPRSGDQTVQDEAGLDTIGTARERKEPTIREAPPPWPEAHTPAGFDRSGRELDTHERGALTGLEGLASGTSVPVDGSERGRQLRAQRARSFASPPSILEQMLGANPGLTRREWSFDDWVERDPDGARFTFTRFYGGIDSPVQVLEDRFEFIGPRERFEIAAKARILTAYNARLIAANRQPIGYIVLMASVIRPDAIAVERALGGAIVTDAPLDVTVDPNGRLDARREYDMSTPAAELVAPAPRAPAQLVPAEPTLGDVHVDGVIEHLRKRVATVPR